MFAVKPERLVESPVFVKAFAPVKPYHVFSVAEPSDDLVCLLVLGVHVARVVLADESRQNRA